MSLFSQLLAIIACFMLIAAVLYVVFGQITVRKLRKNLKTKDTLGFEFVSGWDIINVAQALAMPSYLSRKLKKGSLSPLFSDADLLRKHTNRFDRVLGSIFYWLFITSGLSGALLVLLNFLGVFT